MACVNIKPSKKLIRSKSGLKIVVVDNDHKSPFIICEPLWTPDKEASNCKKCCAKFGFTTRRHHCRRCGHIYCSACCDEKMVLHRMCFVDPVRVCTDCTPTTIQENKFFEHHLKTLTNGAYFFLEQSSKLTNVFVNLDSDNEKEDNVYNNNNNGNKNCMIIVSCKLSQDHRYLIFENVTPSFLTDTDNINKIDMLDNNMKSLLSSSKLTTVRLNKVKCIRVYDNTLSTSGEIGIEMDFLANENDEPSIYKQLQIDQEVFSTNLGRDTIKIATKNYWTNVNSPSHQSYNQATSWIIAMQQAFKMLYGDEHQTDTDEQ